MSDAAKGTAEQGSQKLDMSVKVYPAQNSKNLLATATLTLGGAAYLGQWNVFMSQWKTALEVPAAKPE